MTVLIKIETWEYKDNFLINYFVLDLMLRYFDFELISLGKFELEKHHIFSLIFIMDFNHTAHNACKQRKS